MNIHFEDYVKGLRYIQTPDNFMRQILLHSHFKYKETEAQGDVAICLRPHSNSVIEPVGAPRI